MSKDNKKTDEVIIEGEFVEASEEIQQVEEKKIPKVFEYAKNHPVKTGLFAVGTFVLGYLGVKCLFGSSSNNACYIPTDVTTDLLDVVASDSNCSTVVNQAIEDGKITE